MLRKIIPVLTVFTAVFVCGGLETRTVAAEGFFAEMVKEDFANLALHHQGQAQYKLSSRREGTAALSIQRERPSAPMQSVKYAVYGYILIVNKVNSFHSVTKKDAEKILKNQFQEWPGLGVRVSRLAIAEGAMPRLAVQRLVNRKIPVTLFPDPVSAAGAVSREPASIGILPLGAVPYGFNGVRVLAVDGIEPTPENVFSGKYPLGDLYYIGIRPDAPPEIREFYETLRSRKYRRKILKTGALPVL